VRKIATMTAMLLLLFAITPTVNALIQLGKNDKRLTCNQAGTAPKTSGVKGDTILVNGTTTPTKTKPRGAAPVQRLLEAGEADSPRQPRAHAGADRLNSHPHPNDDRDSPPSSSMTGTQATTRSPPPPLVLALPLVTAPDTHPKSTR
jgi:hypothetical protein